MLLFDLSEAAGIPPKLNNFLHSAVLKISAIKQQFKKTAHIQIN